MKPMRGFMPIRALFVAVTSVLQTTAGRMIFGRHAEPGTVHPGPGLAPEPPGARSDRQDRPDRGQIDDPARGLRPAAQA